MNRVAIAPSSLVIGMVIALCAPSTAQVKYSTSPPGYVAKLGGASSAMFGSYANGRFQFLDTMFTGKGLKMVKGVGYRPDYNTSGYGSQARGWKSVTLDCGDTKFASVSATYSINQLNTPVRVFSAAVSWPALTSRSTTPLLFPSALSFPFKSTWIYTAKNDALLDFRFTGGKTGAGPAWPFRAQLPYALDAPVSELYRSGSGSGYGNWGVFGCFASPNRFSATCLPLSQVFAKSGTGPTTDNKLRYRIDSYFTEPNSQVVHALDQAGSAKGVVYKPVTCNRLHVAASASMLLFFHTANAGGYASTKFGDITYKKIYSGVNLWAQAIWTDPWNKEPLLTTAASGRIPTQPAPPLPRTCVTHLGTNPSTAVGVIVTQAHCNPLVRWTH